MADVFAFRNQQDVLDVLERNRKERAKQLADRGMRDPDFVQPRQRNCWIVPKGTIPARTSPTVPGIGTAYLLYLDREEDPPELKRYQWLDEDVEIEVSNYLDTALVEDESSGNDGLTPIYRASQDVFGELAILSTGGGDFSECSGGGLTIPGLAESPIVSAVDADYVVGIRDGCTVLIEVETCEPESSEPPISEPPISEPPAESEPPIPEDPEDPPTEPEEPL